MDCGKVDEKLDILQHRAEHHAYKGIKRPATLSQIADKATKFSKHTKTHYRFFCPLCPEIFEEPRPMRGAAKEEKRRRSQKASGKLRKHLKDHSRIKVNGIWKTNYGAADKIWNETQKIDNDSTDDETDEAEN